MGDDLTDIGFGVFLLVLEVDIGIAGDTERRAVHNIHAGKKQVEVTGDHVFQPNEGNVTVRACSGCCFRLAIFPQHVRDIDEARDHIRDFEANELGFVVRRAFALDPNSKVEAEVGNERERVRMIDRQRGQYRVDFFVEVLPQRVTAGGVEIFCRGNRNIVLREPTEQIRHDFALLTHGFEDALANFVDQRRIRYAIRAVGRHAELELLVNSCHTHHEKLVRVIADNRQKFNPFEQRDGFVHCLCEHTAVEVDPA